jgi:hypothetical protein
MQLRDARLCLDCEEVHEAQQCPVCASETFAFIMRWVPAREPHTRRRAPEPVRPEESEAYGQLLNADEDRSAGWTLLRRASVGLALFGVAGWLWKSGGQDRSRKDTSYDTGESS